MKSPSPAASCLIPCIVICLVLVSGCTFPPKTNSTPPALITDVQTTISPSPSAAGPGGSCVEGQTICGGACRNTLVDSSNCGRCGNACSASQYCSNGICTAGTLHVPVTGITTAVPAGGLTTATTVSGSSCSGGQTPCSGVCRNLQADASNCGRCGNVCGSGRTCSSGTCSGGSTTTAVTTAPAPLPDGAAAVTTTTPPLVLTAVCDYGWNLCGGTCSNPNTDNTNCGGCGNLCRYGKICVSGVCSCPAGLTVCGYYCFNTNTDTNNCGSCSRACGAGMSCVAGVCSCPASQILCGVTCVNTETDRNNCGGCGTTCPAGTHCSGSICRCDVGNPCGGTCANTETDNYNCGGCGVTCSGGQTCVAGVCTAPTTALCPKYQTACLFKGSVICVDLNTDDSNCGSCGNVCTTGSCSGGVCSFVLK